MKGQFLVDIDEAVYGDETLFTVWLDPSCTNHKDISTFLDKFYKAFSSSGVPVITSRSEVSLQFSVIRQ